jgi:hypothetical protein
VDIRLAVYRLTQVDVSNKELGAINERDWLLERTNLTLDEVSRVTASRRFREGFGTTSEDIVDYARQKREFRAPVMLKP